MIAKQGKANRHRKSKRKSMCSSKARQGQGKARQGKAKKIKVLLECDKNVIKCY
jgi:hypothetical protein